MKQAVLDIFPAFTERLEGKIPWMYLDCLGYVTTGLGCLIDPVTLATDLPWMTRKGTTATRAEIVSEWHAVKDMVSLAKLGHGVAEKYTRLRLNDEGVAQLAKRRLESNEEYFRHTWSDWDDFPADAQLAIMSMGWAMGAGFVRKFKMFTAAVRKHDWLEAIKHCHINEAGNPGIVPRNKLNKKLLSDAAETTTPELLTMYKAPPLPYEPSLSQTSVPWIGLTDEAWDDMIAASEKHLAELERA